MRAIWTVLMRSVHRPQHRNSTVMLNPTKCMFRPWQGGSRSRRCRPGRCPRIGPHTLPVRYANRTGTAGWTRHNISSRILKPSLIMEKKSLSQISSKASHACKTHRCASDMELEPAKASACEEHMRLSPSSSETARGVMPFALRTSSSFATTSGSTWA